MARRGALLALSALFAATTATTSIDYLIVGGGPAGFVLAEQLSRNPQINVALLEAGPDGINSKIINVPGDFTLVQPFVWNYSSQADPNIGGRTPNLAQGHVFGGGSAVNAMSYCRGASSVYDQWANISGNPGLAWKSLLKDFEATAHYTYQPANYSEYVNTSVYGNGPLEVSRASGTTGFGGPYLQALETALNLTEVDMTDGTGIGVTRGLSTIFVQNRTRSYARNTFGRLAASRSNVQLLPNSWVQRISFNNKTAQGVTYTNTLTNKTYTLAAKEIIVSGGAINSPKLLLLSGIGPAATLSALNIPVVADIPAVGKNLFDHHYALIEMQVVPSIITSWQFMDNATEEAIANSEYAKDASGPLGWNDGGEFGCARIPNSVFASTGDNFYPSLPSDRPQVLYQISAASQLMNLPNVSIVSAWPALVQPEAAGYVTINSSDYRQPPLIYSNYFGSASDKAAIMYAYKKLRAITQSNPVRPLVVKELFPGPNVTTDADIWQAIQQSAMSFHHPVGTVALGSVLDSNWRIKGLNNIRVVDSSALPVLPTCHIQADVYAIAHHAAQDIMSEDNTGCQSTS